jgi:hypothetical protein
MDRRNFLSGSLAASALSLATAGDLAAQVGSTADKSAPVPSGEWTGRKAHQCFFCRCLNSGIEPARHWAGRCVLCLLRTG